MDNYKIEVVLVNVDEKVSSNNKPVIKEVEPSDYPIFVKLGSWNNGCTLQFQPYLRAKIEGAYKNVDIAIKTDHITDISINTVSTDAGDYQRFEDSDVVYYVPPGKFQKTTISHYNTVGSEIIKISFNNKTDESMTLISGNAGEEAGFYTKIINDLISIQQHLCMDEKSSMSMAMKWSDKLYQDTERMVSEFCDAFWALEKNAKPELKKFETKQSFQKIKKITSKSIIEHAVLHKNKVRAFKYEENLDTFEHRVIKTYMDRLQHLIDVRQEIEINALNREQLSLQSMLDFSGKDLEDKFNELKRKTDDKKEELLNKIEKLLNKTERNADLETNLQKVCIQIQMKKPYNSSFFQYNMSSGRPVMSLNTNVEDGNARNCNYRIYNNESWSPWFIYKTDGAKKTIYVNVSLPLDCIESAVMLFNFLESDNRINHNGDFIEILGDVIPEYAKGRNDKGYSIFLFDFRKIDSINIYHGCFKDKPIQINLNEISPADMQIYKASFKKYILDIELNNDAENLGFFAENIQEEKIIKEINTKLEDKRKLKKRWTKLKLKLQQAEASDLMKNVSNVKTSIRPTNLFSFDPIYQKIYKIMQSRKNTLKVIDYYSLDEEKYKIANLPELYEIWCYIKMVVLFIDTYNFKLLYMDNENDEDGTVQLKKIINDILDEHKIPNGKKFDLVSNIENGNEMKVTIWYNREFQLNKEVLIEKKMYAKIHHSKLRPDIFMKISYGNKEKLFVFDAKYRGNKKRKYDGIKDLCEVAFQKYFIELSHGMYIDYEFGNFNNVLNDNVISGSFILHSSIKTYNFKKQIENDQEKVELYYNPNKYLGDYPDKWAESEWGNAIINGNWEVSKENLDRWSAWHKKCNNNENKLGIVTCNPEKNMLVYIIQMIMEQQFGLYKSKCWICGSNVCVEQKLTEKGYFKYYITCQNHECGKFMVQTHCSKSQCPSHKEKLKIGKHTKNYYAKAINRNKFTCWNVSCPICRHTLPERNKIKNEQYLGYSNNYSNYSSL